MSGAFLDGAIASAQELRAEEAGAARGGSGLARSLGVKTLSALVTLFFVLVFNFFLFRVLPADPARNITRYATYNAGVTWSRSGGKLAFISERRGQPQSLFVMSLSKPAAAGASTPAQLSAATPAKPGNPIAEAQKRIIATQDGVYFGADTDAINAPADRYDGCHLSGSGARKLAKLWTQAISAPVPGKAAER